MLNTAIHLHVVLRLELRRSQAGDIDHDLVKYFTQHVADSERCFDIILITIVVTAHSSEPSRRHCQIKSLDSDGID